MYDNLSSNVNRKKTDRTIEAKPLLPFSFPKGCVYPAMGFYPFHEQELTSLQLPHIVRGFGKANPGAGAAKSMVLSGMLQRPLILCWRAKRNVCQNNELFCAILSLKKVNIAT